MASSTPADGVYTGDVCLPVEVEVEKEFWDVDVLSIILALIIGAVVGAIIAVICAKLCLRDHQRSKVSLAFKIFFQRYHTQTLNLNKTRCNEYL